MYKQNWNNLAYPNLPLRQYIRINSCEYFYSQHFIAINTKPMIAINAVEQNATLRRIRTALRYLRNFVITRDYKITSIRKNQNLPLNFFDNLSIIINNFMLKIPIYDPYHFNLENAPIILQHFLLPNLTWR